MHGFPFLLEIFFIVFQGLEKAGKLLLVFVTKMHTENKMLK